ncbi:MULTISPECIES: excalibur calcium-binding domain-containing protein [Streptomyces]|uniref:excalibur calcium-binding domain-containing protein n=1 Tax=Streptomyces TaxID=1883 RepID=UPI001908E114|nr:excalibur calcium-binding domain-containing protein [Streptomyces sp. XC 2026]QQN78621.1 excalibur calcium-binding domain-containing protein [Streptomyces sp. XC 2026]
MTGPRPAPPRTTWRHPVVIVLLLVVVPPVGIWLAWRSGWRGRGKTAAMGLSALWCVALVVSDPPEEKAAGDAEMAVAEIGDDKGADILEVPDYTGQNLKTAIASAAAHGYPAVSHDATDADARQVVDGNWTVCFQNPGPGTTISPGGEIDFAVVRRESPCPPADGLAVVYPRMPSVTEMSFGEALGLLADHALTGVEARGAYRDVALPSHPGAWTVCFQRPGAGEEVTEPEEVAVRLSVAEPGVECPAFDRARLRPEPDPEPVPMPETEPEPAPVPVPVPVPEAAVEPAAASGGSGDPAGSGRSGGLAHYPNCDAVRAAGQAPLYRGEPGYRSGLDRDGDGVACET